MRTIIGIIGGSQADENVYALARETGAHIASQGWALVTGGLGGVMHAASEGAKQHNGLVIGILPSVNRMDANPYVDIAVPTGMGYGRNILVVNTAEVVIAMPGSYGTLSEMGFSLNMRKPVIAMPGAWDLPRAGHIAATLFWQAASVPHAIQLVQELLAAAETHGQN